MATFVLLHSGFCGGWIWKDVAHILLSKGHDVHCPSLTGHGERVHLSSPDVGLETQIQDICGVFEYEDLHHVILVGHSGSMIAVAGATEREASRIAHLVYFDTLIPKNGKSWFDLMVPSSVEALLGLAKREGSGWFIPASAMPVANPRFTAQLVKPITDPVVITNHLAAAIPRSFIYCNEKEPGWFYGHDAAIQQAAAEARALGWDYYELPTGHAAMFTMPDAVANLLVSIAQKTNSTK
jgi:pimeloyl-ACP methyl ester carboxylesterase